VVVEPGRGRQGSEGGLPPGLTLTVGECRQDSRLVARRGACRRAPSRGKVQGVQASAGICSMYCKWPTAGGLEPVLWKAELLETGCAVELAAFVFGAAHDFVNRRSGVQILSRPLL
jgi:hypothetical protein